MFGFIGIDVGGTNTDAVILCGKKVLYSVKKPTTRDVISGVKQAIRDMLVNVRKTDPSLRIVQVNIGTTHFVNAVVQSENLTKVSVIRLCGTASTGVLPYVDFPGDLAKVIRGEVYTVNGGFEFDGQEISAIVEDEIKKSAEDSRRKGVNNFVISGIFSPVNSCQEEKAGELIQSVFPDASVTLSHQVGYLGLIERENAAILNESLKQLCKKTVSGFETALHELGLKCPFYLTQNDGTIISSSEATRFPVKTFASGPTNSMRGAAFLSDEPDCIVVDIGGTTTDVGALVKGFPREASAHIKVGGVRTNFRMPDVFSIGLGGGSIVNISDEQQVSVGPRSTGYRLLKEGLVFGGDIFTTTDAAVVLDIADIGDKNKALKRISLIEARATIDKIRVMIEDCIDQMKVSKADVVVVFVGGGSMLVDHSVSMRGAKRLIIPPHYQVANAIGAAISQVSAAVDHVVSLTNLIGEDRFARVVAEAEASVGPESPEDKRTIAVEKVKNDLFAEARIIANKQATERAKKSAEVLGADVVTLQVVEVLDIPLTYIPGNACRIKVKVVGDLAQVKGNTSDVQVGTLPSTLEKESPATSDMEQRIQTTTSTGHSLEPVDDLADPSVNPCTYQPSVDPSTGDWILSEFDIDCITIGAGILGCGGGGSPHIGNVMAKQKIREGKKIKVISPERFQDTADHDSFATAPAFMGAPVVMIEKIENGGETKEALDAMKTLLQIQGNKAEYLSTHGCQVHTSENIIGCDDLPSNLPFSDNSPTTKRITALMSPEMGGLNSVQPLLLGADTGLPVIDCDGMGRAFPELQMYTPFIYGHPAFPACLADNTGRRAAAVFAKGAKPLENYFRKIVVGMGCTAAVMLTVLSPSDVLEKTVPYSISRAWHLGLSVLQSRVNHTSPVTTILNHQNGKLLITGKIVEVSRDTTGGFNRGILTVEGLGEFIGQEVIIDFQNENLVARSKQTKTVLACTPDLITCVDSDRGEPITTEEIRFSLRVSVLALPSCPEMTSPEALCVVGPSAFGYNDVVYQPVDRYINPKPVPF